MKARPHLFLNSRIFSIFFTYKYQVYLPALEGHVPVEMIQTVSAFLDFCYLVRKDTIDTHALQNLDDALHRFREHRTIFVTTGIQNEDNLEPPRQHSMDHYSLMIREFGSPNGLCTSITESKHIKAVKEPWRRSNRFQPLQQMLVSNARMDKIAAARVQFEENGMLGGDIELNEGTSLFLFDTLGPKTTQSPGPGKCWRYGRRHSVQQE